MDLTVIIVNYNVREFLKQALTSVQAASAGMHVQTIVVDNNSADGSADMVLEHFPSVHLIQNSENTGFGRANNQALRIARGRAILLLNPDTIIQEDTLRVLTGFLDRHADAGAVGCKILNPDGTFALESRRAFPTPLVAVARMTGLSRLFAGSETFGRYNLTYKPIDAVCEVDALSGSCMMLRKAALTSSTNLGAAPDMLFDEQFFMYGEDIDLCYRIQKAGWKLYYEPATQIIHYKGESTKKGDLRYVRLFYGAMVLFTEKHFHGRNAGLLILLLKAGIVCRAGLSAASRLIRRLAPPLLDFAIALASFAVAAAWRFDEASIPSGLLSTVTPAYAVATVSALALLGGYRFGHRTKKRFPVVASLFGLVSIAALSFFFNQFAFSRIVVGVGTVLSAVSMSGWRAVWRGDRERSRRALIVGPAETAQRLNRILEANPAPPFDLIGYVSTDESSPADHSDGGVRMAGRLQHLRDVARMEQAGCIIFVPGAQTNEDIFGCMQSLRDLPIQFKMLGSTESHVIGKSSIEQLTLPALVEAGQALGLERSNSRHRLFDIVVATSILVSAPLLLAGRLAGSQRARILLARIGMLPSVVVGRRSIVGFDESTAYRPPPRLGIKPGLFPVSIDEESEPELDRRYGFYAVRQSAGIDWAIVRRRLSQN